MTSGEWLFAAAGGAVALAGLGLLGWALLGDRLRTRRARRRGDLRRCPRCWYDMTATDGLICPECGRDARRERRLGRSRRRWRWAAVGLAVVAVGAGTAVYPHGRGGAGRRWLPDTVLIGLIPRLRETWPLEEMLRRQRVGTLDHEPALPNHLWDWQRRLLADGCAVVAGDPTRGSDSILAWRLLAARVPCTEAVVETIIAVIRGNSEPDQVFALLLLRDRLHALPESQLARVRAAVAAKRKSGGSEDWTGGALLAIDAEVAHRSSDAHREQMAWAGSVELTPDGLAGNSTGLTVAQLAVVNQRLGLPPPRFDPTGEEAIPLLHMLGPGLPSGRAPTAVWGRALSPGDPVVDVRAQQIHLNDDDQVDCLLHFGVADGSFKQTLVFLQRDEQWNIAGWFGPDAPSPLPTMESVECEGRRWLLVRYTHPLRAASPWVDTHWWYRVVSGRLRLVQATLAESDEPTRGGVLVRRIRADPPQIVHEGGRFVARYSMRGDASLSVHLGTKPARWTGKVWEREGVFDYALDSVPVVMGVPVGGGPWDGRAVSWVLDSPDEDLRADRGALLGAAVRGGDATERQAILNFLRSLPQSDELRELRSMLESLP